MTVSAPPALIRFKCPVRGCPQRLGDFEPPTDGQTACGVLYQRCRGCNTRVALDFATGTARVVDA